MKNFTQNDLMLYVFNEAEPQITKAITLALKTDVALQKRIQEIQEDLKEIENLEMNPNPKSIEIILQSLQKDSEKQMAK